jgi:hypothetical protein
MTQKVAAPQFWNTPAAALAAIPVAKADKPEHEEEIEPVMDEDVEPELTAQEHAGF